MNNRFLRQLYFAAAFITGCLFLCACENDIKDVHALGKKKPGIDEVYNMVSYLSEVGRVKAKLTAPLMLRYQDTPRFTFPKTLHVDFYDSTLKVESQLFAKYGQYLDNQDKVYLKDSVVVFNVKGDTLFCDDLWWDKSKESFSTDKKVSIHKPFGETTNGIGLTAKQDFSKWTIFKIQPNTFFNYADSGLTE
ncbi:LPS export ABC transporter periplasmic protein LptC [Foetidibacter luteolus]|uniref:LPS export ABC transporter periplasmic protein LptC n=1 Tax=Foetidibacter luteolus TaxID=2608880 RepID=UPI00129AA0EB|nr:LPS export ABC transporter periplasmic protein LptC [Foetidibacter luteolus]